MRHREEVLTILLVGGAARNLPFSCLGSKHKIYNRSHGAGAWSLFGNYVAFSDSVFSLVPFGRRRADDRRSVFLALEVLLVCGDDLFHKL